MLYPQKIETVHLETLENELCIYDWQRKEVHNLNLTAATVWQLCDGRTTPQQIARRLQAAGDLTPEQAEELVWLTLQQLEKANLLQDEVVQPAGRRTLTRREVLKGLGVAAIMLPVVSSIVAPGPVAAQSPVPTATATPQPTATPTSTPVPPIILFNAGGTFDGDLGGRAGADTICQTSANRPSGYANVRAFISISAADSISNMPTNYGVPTNVPIQSSNGTVIANDWADLLDGTIDATLAAAGVIGAGSRFWSGSNADGSLNADNCNGWTDGVGTFRGRNGHASFSDSNWLSEVDVSCNLTTQILGIAF